MVPSHPIKVPPCVGPDGVIGVPQLSFTNGGVGSTASDAHATTLASSDGIVKSSYSIVTVCT